MPSGVYERTPETEAARIAKMQATRAKKRKGKPAGRDWAAEYARRKKAGTAHKARASRAKKPGSPQWTPERTAKFKATMAAKRAARELKLIERNTRKAGKQALLNGSPRPVGRPSKDKRPTSVTVLEADGSLATYVLTTVQAYVRQP